MKLLSFVIALLVAPGLAAQTPPAGQGTSGTAAARRRVPPAVTVVVRDASGTPIDGVHVKMSSGADQTTDASGTARFAGVAPGSYRLHLERDGFVTLERDVVIKAGAAAPVDVVLSIAPPPPPPPPPPAPAPPAPKPEAGPSGPPVFVGVPQFLDKNFIGREPLKESVIGCTPDATTRLLQVKDSVATHTHGDLDETLYVVAGDGAIRMNDSGSTPDVRPIAAGTVVVLPRGVAHAIERRGKNPLILLSTLSGEPCSAKK